MSDSTPVAVRLSPAELALLDSVPGSSRSEKIRTLLVQRTMADLVSARLAGLLDQQTQQIFQVLAAESVKVAAREKIGEK